jgi:hypothetical protein
MRFYFFVFAFTIHWIYLGIQGSSVSIVTGYGLGDLWIETRTCPDRPGTHSTPALWVPSHSRGKGLGIGVDHSTHLAWRLRTSSLYLYSPSGHFSLFYGERYFLSSYSCCHFYFSSKNYWEMIGSLLVTLKMVEYNDHYNHHNHAAFP